ncbi:MAG TPA: pyrroline-5-carboxylate reductase [Thermoanaerobaculia bacterium]|nr:pyrroline-5-carboxylate reductase [Thermoanaerobaculia bacterium]
METRLAFIGSGIMAEVMIRGLLTHELASPDRIWAAGPRLERAEQLARDYGVHGTTDNVEAIAEADLIVLAVKPGTLAKVLRQIRGALRPEHVVVSIVAGARTAAIAGALGRPAVVRCVPNLPCRVGRGLTIWTATPEVPAEARETVRSLLRTLGREVYFPDEDQVDRATAAYGTGPALLAQFVKALEDAAVFLGEPRSLAREMLLETILGTAAMMLASRCPPTELIDEVTSPGGITSRALHALNQGRFPVTLNEAIQAAYGRTLETGDQLDAQLRKGSS